MTRVLRSVTDKAFAPADNAKSVGRYCVVFMVVTTTCFSSIDVSDTLVYVKKVGGR
jgi:hypothetical protein